MYKFFIFFSIIHIWLCKVLVYGQPPYTGGAGDGFSTASIRTRILTDGTVGRSAETIPQTLVVWPVLVSGGETLYIQGYANRSFQLYNGLGQKVAEFSCPDNRPNAQRVQWVLPENLVCGVYTIRSGSQRCRIQVNR